MIRAGDRVRVQEPHELAGMTGDVSGFYGPVAVVRLYAWQRERSFRPGELTVINDEPPMSLSEARFRARVKRVRREMGRAA